MRYREKFTFYTRKMKNGKVIYYYRTYDDNGNRKAFSTGQTSRSKALEFVLDLIKKDKLIPDKKENIFNFQEFTENFFVWDKCEYIIDKNTFGGKSISSDHAYTERGYIVNHIRPYFKKRPMESINEVDIKNYIIKLKKDGRVNGTINHILKIVKIIFSEAVRRKVINENPAAHISYLPSKQKDRGILTIEEAHKLFDEGTMREVWGCETTYILNIFAIMTGCRRGEIIGLLNKYVHNEYVEIIHSWSNRSGLKSTKTNESRVIPIHSGLSRWLNMIKGENPDGFIFSFDDGEKPYPDNRVLKILYSALEKIGISEEERKERNITFHSFRHFFNTYCRANNVTDDKVRAVTGHKTQAMVDNYTHFNINDFKEVLDVQGTIINQV